jgi:WD40 repeat protein
VVDAVAISPDNRWVVTGSDDKTARLWLVQINKKFVGQSDVTDAIEKLQAHSHFGRPDIIQNSSRVRT